jgi:hypothetical protein
MLRREPRELYRLYDEEEFLSPEGLADPPAEASVAGLTEHEAEATHGDTLEPSSPPIARLAPQRRRRVTPAMVLATGLGLVAVAAIEMHASVGRVTRPVQAPRFRSSDTSVGRTSRRVGRRRFRGRPARGAASAGKSSAGHRGVASDPNGSRPPVRGTAGGATATNPAAAASPPHEFGFEQ